MIAQVEGSGTGAGGGDAAIAPWNPIRLRHLDMERRTLFQDARHMATKRAKTFTTDFYPVEGDAEAIVGAWRNELATEHLFGPDDPLLPATLVGPNESGVFGPIGLKREPWSDAAPIRAIFRRAFAAAGLPYFHPHSLRRTLVQLAYEMNLTHKELRAWSLNLGHDSVLTSVVSYGHLDDFEKAEVMRGIAARRGVGRDEKMEQLKALVAAL
jgi:integrase